jgi:hypothetical protein
METTDVYFYTILGSSIVFFSAVSMFLLLFLEAIEAIATLLFFQSLS